MGLEGDHGRAGGGVEGGALPLTAIDLGAVGPTDRDTHAKPTGDRIDLPVHPERRARLRGQDRSPARVRRGVGIGREAVDRLSGEIEQLGRDQRARR